MGPQGSVFEGKTLDEAVRKGLEALGLSRPAAMITVVAEGSSGFLGFGARPFKVRVMPRPGGAIQEAEVREDDDRRGRGRGSRDRGGRERGGRDRGTRGGRDDRGGRPDGRGGQDRGAPVETGAPRADRGDRPAHGDERRGGRGRRDERPRGGDRARDDRPREDRPRGERPGDDRPRTDRPSDDRPRGERPSESRGYREDRPRGEDRAASGDRERGRGDGRGEDRGRGADRGRGEDFGRGAPAPRREMEPVESEAVTPADPMAEGGMDAAGDDRDRRRRRRRGRRGGSGRAVEAGGIETGGGTAVAEPMMASVADESHAEEPMSTSEAGPALDNDALAAEGKRWTEQFLKAMGFEATVRSSAEGDRVNVTATVENDEQLLTGQKGEVRQALQQLLNRMINRGDSSRYHLQLEINDFWEKRERELEELARRLAGEALETNNEVVTDYLNAQERRIIHVTLREDARVKTWSLGTGHIKRLAVAPAGHPGGETSEG